MSDAWRGATAVEKKSMKMITLLRFSSFYRGPRQKNAWRRDIISATEQLQRLEEMPDT